MNEHELKTKQLRHTAIGMCVDWITSETYKHVAPYATFREASQLWQIIQQEKRTSGRLDYEEVIAHWQKAFDYAVEEGWLSPRVRKVGRPRKKQHTNDAEHHALYLLDRMDVADSTKRRLMSVAGEWQPQFESVVMVSGNLFAALLEDAPLAFDELTREELGLVVGFNERATNELWRWLKGNGWKELKKRRRNELGEVTRVRVISQMSVKS